MPHQDDPMSVSFCVLKVKLPPQFPEINFDGELDEEQQAAHATSPT